MNKDLLKILVIFLLLFSACRKSETDSETSGIGILGASDQTQEAADLIEDANADLKKIRAIYKKNESRMDDLKAAMDNKETDKVKQIADELVYQINDGMALGETAISKIGKAQDLNTNETFKDYLRLKEDALNKQLTAFEFRRKAGILLRDGFGGTDKQEIDKAKAVWKDLEENFQKYMDVARERSVEANKLYKDSLKKE